MQTCRHCETKFTARLQAVGGKPQRYCSVTCRRAAQNTRAKAHKEGQEQHTKPSEAISAGSNVLGAVQPAYAPTQSALNVEWLNVFDDLLHRAVAGRQNPAQKDGGSTLREFAVGMDRPPLGHAVLTNGEWIGKVRARGAVIWASERFSWLEDAKRSVETQLGGLPELVSESLALAA
jgi:hypothetical protein